MNTDDVDLFRWRLAETMAWCAARTGTPRSALRTAALHPSVPLKNRCDAEQTAADVDRVVRERAHLLHQAHAYPHAPAYDLAGGRLLFSAPDDGFVDGASEDESQGFIDVADTPPWDTRLWFRQESKESTDFYDGHIVSWVPPAFVTYADAGIRVSFVNNISWATKVNSTFSHWLRAVGLA